MFPSYIEQKITKMTGLSICAGFVNVMWDLQEDNKCEIASILNLLSIFNQAQANRDHEFSEAMLCILENKCEECVRARVFWCDKVQEILLCAREELNKLKDPI